jgi:uncharacterized protein YijF (DUF1287 family)
LKLHQIKSSRHWYELVVEKQEKNFEIRKNDRGYQAGDAIIFWEVDNAGTETGIKSKPFIIEHVVTHSQYPEGIKEGYCVFSVIPHQFLAMDLEEWCDVQN